MAGSIYKVPPRCDIENILIKTILSESNWRVTKKLSKNYSLLFSQIMTKETS